MLFNLSNAVVYRRAGEATCTLNNRNSAASDCHGFGRSANASATLVQMRPNSSKLLHEGIDFLHKEELKKS